MDKEFNLVHIFTIFYNIADERMERGKKGEKKSICLITGITVWEP